MRVWVYYVPTVSMEVDLFFSLFLFFSFPFFFFFFLSLF